MSNKIKLIAFFMVIIVLVLTVGCQQNESGTGGLEYTLLDDGTYAVSLGTSTNNNIVIPSLYNTKPVTQVAKDGFSNCDSLTSVTIPDSVTFIGKYAFAGCEGLKSITISNNVTEIADSAFNNCDSLTSVTIPDSVNYIDRYAFYSCDSLTKVVIPNSVTEIGNDAFAYCDNLKTLIFNGSVRQWEELIEKNNRAFGLFPDKVVVCSDGEVSIK